MSEWYGLSGAVYGRRYFDQCKAQPQHGGHGLCILEAFHRGPHKGPSGTFTRVSAGSSPRSWAKTRIRLRDARKPRRSR